MVAGFPNVSCTVLVFLNFSKKERGKKKRGKGREKKQTKILQDYIFLSHALAVIFP